MMGLGLAVLTGGALLNVLRRIGDIRPGWVFGSWPELQCALENGAAPALLLVDGGSITQAGESICRDLAARAALPPGILFLHSASNLVEPSVLFRFHRLGFILAADERALQQVVATLSETEVEACSRYLTHRFGGASETVSRLLQTLAIDRYARLCDVAALAEHVRVPRRTLYARLRYAGLPSPEACQYLFRLIPAVAVLRNHGNIETAAAMAEVADSRSLRGALKRRLDLSIREARSTRSWHDVSEGWLRTRERSRPPRTGTVSVHARSSRPPEEASHWAATC